jgi:glycerate dehydrogenase
MADALTTGKVRAFCADVLATEPPSSECPLLGLPNAFITPHIAWATREARMRIITIMHNNLKAFTEGNPINVVNP